MKRAFIIFVLCLSGCTATQITQALNEANQLTGNQQPTTGEVGDGLREALVKGISAGSDIVSQPDGYFKNPEIKIPFPPDIKKVEDRLRELGLGSDVDKFILTLNRGAEDAAKDAKPIFMDAIKQMSINDAWGILRGTENAATQYLQKTTTQQLLTKFKPVIQNSLNKVNATRYYGEIVSTYNKIPLVQKVNPDLDDYATTKAVEGLFVMIAKEEKNIRQNPLARTSDLLKKVFGSK